MRWALAGFLILIPALSRADFNGDARGTTTANFLKLGVGARAEGMGEAYTAVADDATALYWNPSGLARVESQSVTFMHAPYLASTYYDYGAYARRWGHHALGAGIQYFSAGSINQTDENNSPLGSYNPYDLAASIGYAYRFSEEGLALGIAGKYIQSKILDTASALAVDFGAQSRWYGDRLRLAFATVNLGGKMKFEQDSESLPLALKYGGALKLTRRWLVSADLVTPKDDHPTLALGTEFGWDASEAVGLVGRLGYNSLTSGDISGVTGLSFGFGLGFKKMSFDYAFLPYGGLGITHRLSLTFKWGEADDGNISNLQSKRGETSDPYSSSDIEKNLP